MAKNGYIDWAVPMNYTRENSVFEKNIRSMLNNIPKHYLKQIVMGIEYTIKMLAHLDKKYIRR